jgi:mannosyltransferase
MNNLQSSRKSLSRDTTVLLCGVTCLALLLRLVHLGGKSLWIDEMWSISIARMPMQSLFWVVKHQDPNMSLYYLLLHLWMRIGDSEVVVRGLSVLLAVATPLAVYALAEHFFGKWVGLVAATLLAVNAFHIQWSQEARGYSLVVLLVTLSSWLFVKCVESPGVRNWLLYGAVSVLAVYVHFFALLVLMAHWVSLLFLPRGLVPWKGLVATTATTGILTIPVGLLLYERTRDPFIPFDWIPKSSAHDLYDVFYTLSGNATFSDSQGGKLLLVAYFVVCFPVLVHLAKLLKSSRQSAEIWSVMLLVAWLCVPIGAVFAVSVVHPMYVSRYLLICLPSLVVLAAKGMCSLKQPWAQAVTLCAIVALAGARLPQYYRYRSSSQEWKTATQYLLTAGHPGDAVLFCVPPGRLLFEYYRDRYYPQLDKKVTIAYPEYADDDRGPQTILYLPTLSEDVLKSLGERRDRVWVVLYRDKWKREKDLSNHVQELLAGTHANVTVNKLGEVTLLLYTGNRP